MIKPITVTNIYGEECVVDDASKKLYRFSNKNKKIQYAAQIIENGELKNSWTDFIVEGTVDDIDEKLQMFGNPVKHSYAIEVKFDVEKNDPKRKLWNEYVQHVKDNYEKYFTKKGDWRRSIYNASVVRNGDWI